MRWRGLCRGVGKTWPHHVTGFAAHWDKNANLATAFDDRFLNLFPRAQPFKGNKGGYVTLSFIPTLGTMILGLIAGGALRRERGSGWKIGWLILVGTALGAAGWGLGELGVCPIVKRIWTPSWVLFSGGLCFWLLAAWYAVIDVVGLKSWAFPFVVIGMNSIAAYCMSGLFKNFILDAATTHLGRESFGVLGPEYQTLVSGGMVLLVLWLILFWMYRRRIFLRI